MFSVRCSVSGYLSIWPVLTPARNDDQLSESNFSVPPAVSLLSRTWTIASALPISTQFPFGPLEYEDFRQRVIERSVIAHTFHDLVNAFGALIG
jgi:hypothetical protein